MEPIKAASQLGTDLQKPVPTGDMCKFMGEYDSPALLRPFRSHCGKYDEWPKNSPSYRHGYLIATL
jgi:hypothetical protein